MSIRSFISAAGALAIVAGAPMALQAQNPRADFQADNAFVSQVAASNLLEVRLGQTAQSKAQTPRVKSFAAKMVNDHTSSQQNWMALARKHGASFNARLSSEQQLQMDQLSRLSGLDFEQAYMDQMKQNHQNNLNTFTTQGRAARSADVRELVERSIPVIQEHLNLATQIRGEIGGAPVAAARGDTQPAAGAPTTPWENVKRDPPRRTEPQPSANQQNQANAANVGARGTGDIKKDKKFVVDMQNHHFLEKSLGELAARKGQNEQVREYGRKTANDHANMEEQWIRMANNNGLSLQPAMGPKHRERLTKLEKKSGRSFDKEYMTMEVSQHKGYLNALMKEGRGANSSDVRELSERFTVTEVNHFNLAKQVGAQVGADTSAMLRTTTSVK